MSDETHVDGAPTAGEGALLRLLLGAIPMAFLGSFAVKWFAPSSLVGIGDWDWYFSDAWISGTALLERGRPALWSIQQAGGVPLAGDPESLSHSPFLVVPLAFGPIVGTKLLVVLLLLAGFVGCRRLGLRWIGEPVGATAFAFVFVFSGYFAIHLRAGHLPWAAFHLVPWILLFTDQLLFDPAPSLGTSLGLVVSLVLVFTGFMYHALVFFLLPVIVIYGIVNGRHANASRIRHVVNLARCAVAIAMPRWLSIIDWEQRSPRIHAGYGGMPLLSIAEMLLTPIPDYNLWVPWGGSGVWEYWSYVGIIVSLLALGALGIRRRPRTFALACLGVAAVLAWRGPWGSVLGWIAPRVLFLSSVRVYSRFLVLAVFAIALLAGSAIAWLRSSTRDRGASLPLLLLFAIATEYWLVVWPIWTKVFALPAEEVYSDWGITLPGPRYHSIRSAPPFQPFAEHQEMFNSRMLPLLMAGAIVGNAYVAMVSPWERPPDGSVVQSRDQVTYRLDNQEIKLFGDFRRGDRIKINLRYPTEYWRVADPRSARIEGHRSGTIVTILTGCRNVRVVLRTGLETAAWIVSGISLIALWLVLRRRTEDLSIETVDSAAATSSSTP